MGRGVARAVLLGIALVAGGCSSSDGAATSPTAMEPLRAGLGLAVPPSGASTDPSTPSTPDLAAFVDPTGLVGRLAGRRICLDPGHDSKWSRGATGRDAQGNIPLHPTERIRIQEVDLALRISYRLQALLEAEGADVCNTRREDGSLQIEPYDFTGDGRVRTEGQASEDAAERLQPRIDWANQFDAEVFVSIHFNGSGDSSVHGTEIYYTDVGPTAAYGRALGDALMRATLDEMRARGFQPTNRGVHSDKFRSLSNEKRAVSLRHNAEAIIRNGADPANCPDCQRLLVLGNNPTSLHLGTYVGALVELEYLSNPTVVEDLVLRRDAVDLLATGLANGLVAYFEAR